MYYIKEQWPEIILLIQKLSLPYIIDYGQILNADNLLSPYESGRIISAGYGCTTHHIVGDTIDRTCNSKPTVLTCVYV